MDHHDHCLHCRRLLDYTCEESHRREHCPSFQPRSAEEAAAPRLHRRDYLPLASHLALLAALGAGIVAFWAR